MSLISARLTTLEAMALLPLARLLVDLVPIRYWRWTITGKKDQADLPENHGDRERDAIAGRLAVHLERAAGRLPVHMKCLPRAVALQWMLRRRGIGSAIVIAIKPGDSRESHDYHAWLERGGTMLIGHCDRTQYRPLMTLGPATQAGHPD